MPKLCLSILLLALLLPSARAAAPRVIFEYQRHGGFVGFNDTFKVHEDFSWTLKGRLNSGKGTLKPEQRKKLGQLLGTFGNLKHEQSDGPKVADGMSESVVATGTGKGTADKAQREAALKAARQLVGAVSRDLPRNNR